MKERAIWGIVVMLVVALVATCNQASLPLTSRHRVGPAGGFQQAKELHQQQKAECAGYPPVLAAQTAGDSLTILTGTLTSSPALVFLDADDVWPRSLIPGVPLLVCEDSHGRVIWVGHAGFEGQESYGFPSCLPTLRPPQKS